VRFDEASLGRFEPKTNPTRGKARRKSNRHPNGEVLLDNADAVIDALPLAARPPWYDLRTMSLEFEWDPKMAEANRARHGIDFDEKNTRQ
jgi:hypothetical protein